MNILIVNQPAFNRGDESAHKGLIRTLLNRIPDVHIKVMSPSLFCESVRQYAVASAQVEYIESPYGFMRYGTIISHGLHKDSTWLWHFHPTTWKYKKLYEWADIVMCAPGGICMGGFQDWNHLFNLKLAKFFKRPLAYYGRSFGPFPTETKSNRQFKKLSLEMLHYFSFLSIRDHKTELLADELGISYVPTVDSAFLDSPKVEIPYEIKAAIGDKPYMVFVPNYLIWHYAYKGKISHETVLNFYSRVMDEMWAAHPECNIVMLPQIFCGRNYAFNDVEMFRDLAKMKKDKRLVVTADCYSSDIQQSIIASAELLIGARYHSVVFAINQNTPFIALSYEHKISGLLETLGKQDCCIDFTNTLLTESGQNSALIQIRELLPNLKKDPAAQAKAKKIANECMDQFVEFSRTI